MQPRPELECRESVQNGRCSLALVGELDLVTAPRLDAAIGRICAGDAAELLLDLRELTFMDSTGLRVMLAAAKTCTARDCRLLVTHANPQVERLFKLTDTARAFRFIGGSDGLDR
jgi:anti-sigma B factor antagonist